jgi:hypothetical protein
MENKTISTNGYYFGNISMLGMSADGFVITNFLNAFAAELNEIREKILRNTQKNMKHSIYDLPEILEVSGKNYVIRADFRPCIDIMTVFEDKSLPTCFRNSRTL